MSLHDDIAEGIAAGLASLGINGNGYLMSPVVPPCFEVDFSTTEIAFNRTSTAATLEMPVVVRLIAQIGDTTEAQKDVHAWLDPSGATSVKTLLEADRTLGGKVDDLFVRSAVGPTRLATPDKPNAQLLQAEFTVDLIVTT